MNNTLLISGHPNLEKSVANQGILDLLADESNITVRKLDTLYPDYRIDIAAEQAALQSADTIVFQFPLYWSTYPAIMKIWFDEVFTYNFAFGPEGDKLKGKRVILSITCGATANSYSEGEFNFFPLPQYLQAATHPIKAAQMAIVDEVITFEMNSTESEGGNRDQVMQQVRQHTEQLLQAINQINQ
ncbi:NAD(P)H-dependent oxidoreductase [Shewanella corallii]|uniref:NAD(P)H-dependent oxidoreductase n=1 Tax=Shewanella corallii TaxID=560080 RepID=A0ABT0N636_9GAMM|nr:NAD(P)H-dependent oxidoreductase [Shewanella corallii]